MKYLRKDDLAELWNCNKEIDEVAGRPSHVQVFGKDLTSKYACYDHDSVENEREICDAVAFFEDEHARVILLSSDRVKHGAYGCQTCKCEDAVAKLHRASVNHTLNANRKGINSMVKEQAERWRIINIPGMFPIHLIENPINEIANCLSKEECTRYRVLGIGAHSRTIQCKQYKPGPHREHPPSQRYLLKRRD